MPLLLLLAAVALVGIPNLMLPPGRDQAIFTVVGRAIADGGFPYRDAFDFKPPGIHLVYALSHLLGGGSMVVTHLLDLISVLVAVAGLYLLLARGSRLGAVVAGAAYGVAYVGTLRYWDLAQPEGLIATGVILAFLAFRRSRSTPGWAAAAGLCLGAACLMKYNAILFVPLVAAVDRLAPDGDSSRPVPSRMRLGLLAVGAAVPVAAGAGWLVLGGAWSSFREIQTEYLPGYSRLLLAGGFDAAFDASLRIVVDFFTRRPLWLLPIVAGVPITLLIGRRPGRWIPMLGILFAAAGVIAQGKFFHYHWLPALPFLSWVLGDAVDAVWTRVRRTRTATAFAAALLAVGLATAATSVGPVWGEKRGAVSTLVGATSRETFARNPAFGTFGVGDHAFSATLSASRALGSLTEPGERVFVWGFEPWMYVAAERPLASRFIYNVAFLSPWCPPSWGAELVADLEQAPPAVIVVVAHDALPWVTGVPVDSRSSVSTVPGLAELLHRAYRPVGREEHFEFYRRLDEHP
jgi:hypothetical protein